MNFDNFMVKIAGNENFQGLQKNKQEQIRALVKGYEKYAIELQTNALNTFERIKREQSAKENQLFYWGMVVDTIPSLFLKAIEGIGKGITDLITGAGTIAVQFANNLKEIFVEDGRFGDDWNDVGGLSFKGWKEMFSDIVYTFADPFISIGVGLFSGAEGVLNTLGIKDDTATNKSLELIRKQDIEMRGAILGTGDIYGKERFKYNDETKKFMEERTDDWALNSTVEINRIGQMFKNEYISKIGDNSFTQRMEQSEVGSFMNETFESMGRMIPAIAVSYLGLSPEMAKGISSSYFFASSFGGAMGDALEKGASLQDAYNYAYGIAAIETLTEQIGGVQFGEGLPGEFVSSAISEAIEEAISEMASAGVETLILGEDIDNSDVWKRVGMSALGGALSGGTFATFGKMSQSKTTVGRMENLQNQVVKVYENNDNNIQKTQNAFNKSITKALESLNKDSTMDNALLQKGQERTQEGRLEAKKEVLKNSDIGLVIEFNEKSKQFELTSLGKEMVDDIKKFKDGKQQGKALDVDNLAISNKKDGGIIHPDDVVIATKEDISKLEESKQKVVNNMLEKGKNLVFVKDLQGTDGFLQGSNGVMYIDINLATPQMLIKTQVHETVHKIRSVNSKGYEKLKKTLMNKKLHDSLKKMGFDYFPDVVEQEYARRYRQDLNDSGILKQMNDDIRAQFFLDNAEKLAKNEITEREVRALADDHYIAMVNEMVNDMVQEERVAHFIEEALTNESVLKKVLKTSPQVLEILDLETKKVFKDADKKTNKVVARMEKLFVKYGKEASRYNRGSLIDAVENGRHQTTYVKVGDTIFKVGKNLTGFFNSEHDLNIEASLDETHHTMLNDKGEMEMVDRKYSEFSKKELINFFKLFSIEGNEGNNIDAIIDNLLLEYDNQIEYREIIGTKFSYIWNLAMNNPSIREEFIKAIEIRKNEVIKEARKNKQLKKARNIKGLYRVNDASVFREIFALNYIISDPRYAQSVSLYTTDTYINEVGDMYIFNEGRAGFVVSKQIDMIDEKYKLENKRKYTNLTTTLESREFSSFFNTHETIKTSKEITNFIINDLNVENIVATNEKLESIYKEWGFTEESTRYDYFNKIMSEWSNSYNNMLVHNTETNKTKPIYLIVNKPGQVKKYKLSQYDIVKKYNENKDIKIKQESDIKTFDEVVGDSSVFIFDDFTHQDALNSLAKNFVMIYSPRQIRPGDIVYTSSSEVKNGLEVGKNVYQRLVDLGEVAWFNGREGHFTGNLTGKNTQFETLRQEKKVVKKMPLDEVFVDFNVENRQGALSHLLKKHRDNNYKTIVNGKEISEFRHLDRGYKERGYFSESALREFNYHWRLSLPIDNNIFIDGEYKKITKDMLKLDNLTPQHTHWTTELIVEEMNKIETLPPLNESQILKIKELENTRQLGKILQYKAVHHVGSNLEHRVFYTFNHQLVLDYLETGNFKYDTSSKQLYLAPYEMEISEITSVFDEKNKRTLIKNDVKKIKGYGAFLAETGIDISVVGKPKKPINFEFFPGYIFGRIAPNGKLESKNSGGIMKIGDEMHLVGRDDQIDRDVRIHNIAITTEVIHETNLDYQSKQVLEQIIAMYKKFSDVNMLKISQPGQQPQGQQTPQAQTIVRPQIITSVDSNIESKFLRQYLNESETSFRKINYVDRERTRKRMFNDIDKKALKQKPNGDKILAIINDLESQYKNIVSKNFKQEQLYNHFFSNFIQFVSYELANNFETTFKDKNAIVDKVEKIIAETLAYVDNVNIGNETNMLDASNPKGYQYIRSFHYALRELKQAQDDIQIQAVLSKGALNPIFDVLNEMAKLDIQNNESIKTFRIAVRELQKSTRTDYAISTMLDNSKAPTVQNSLKQNNFHIENLSKLVGTNQIVHKNGKKIGVRKVDGLLGKITMFWKPVTWALDPFSFSNIFGLFMEDSTGKVIADRTYDAQKKILEVDNAYHNHFEHDGFLKVNRKQINALEKQVSQISNLTYEDGSKVSIPNSQVMYLRNILLREIVRNRMIEMGYRDGEISRHFRDGGFININENVSERKQRKGNSIKVKIDNVIDLFLELDAIIEGDSFMKRYNKRVLGFFDKMYEYANIRNKDVSGFELTNDKFTIENLMDVEKDALIDGLGEVDISLIYVPMRLTDGGKSDLDGAFSMNTIFDLGISDGMVMGITNSNATPMIDSMNIIIPQYAKNVSNYYGLFRLINDLNILFNKRIPQSDGSATTLSTKLTNINPEIIPYYEELLKDMSGYSAGVDGVYESFNRLMGGIKRNFYKASLGLNIKVIFTQFSSMFTMGLTHGDLTGVNQKWFLTKLMKNTLSGGSKTKADYYIKNSEIYKNRERNSTYAVGEASDSGFLKDNFKTLTEATMKGITFTDNMINRAFFITLKEMGYSDQKALEITDRAITDYQSSALTINKTPLLRTRHELVRIFTKFLGEPMKAISNIIESSQKLNITKKFETNYNAIVDSFDNDVSIEEQKLDVLMDEKAQLESDLSNATLPKEVKRIEKELKTLVVKTIPTQETVVRDTKENRDTIKRQIDGVIADKSQSQKMLARRTTALIVSISWQAILGTIFELVRKRGLSRDKDEDEEVLRYIGKLYLSHLGNEAAGYLPFIRDIYGTLASGYDFDTIGELQAFSNLAVNVSNMFKDILNGGEFDWGKHIRLVSRDLGSALGIPMRQIERLFTTPTQYLLNDVNYAYKDITGQRLDSKELNIAVKNGDEKMIQTILDRKMKSKGLILSESVNNEINRLAKNNVILNPSGVQDSFSIDGIEYKNDKVKFQSTYEKANHVIEKIILTNQYKRLDDEHKGKLIKAIFTYYHTLAKQEVSGVKLFTKERTYNLNQAYRYFVSRIPYYMDMQKKAKKNKRTN